MAFALYFHTNLQLGRQKDTDQETKEGQQPAKAKAMCSKEWFL